MRNKFYNSTIYIFLVIIGIILIYRTIFFSDKLFVKLADLVIFFGCISALIRSLTLENYLLILDKKQKINLFQHMKGLVLNLKKALTLLALIKPIFEKGEFEKERKQINLITYLTYILIVSSVIIMNID